MEKKWMILICFFSMLTLISSIICSSLVFYNEKARTDANSSKVLKSNNIYKNASIIYNQNNTLNLSSLNPGYTLEQTFLITNNNSNTMKYNLEWTDVVSTWYYSDSNNAHPEEFAYSLACTNGERVNNKQMPDKEKDLIILENLELKTNKSNECTITIKFANTGKDQSYNANKSFKGTYKAVIKE